MSEPSPPSLPTQPSDKPPPPPGLAPPPVVVPVPAAAEAGTPREVGLTLSAGWLEWLPAGALTVAFLLTFFTWVGAYPGGHKLFSQNAWDALGKSISPNLVPKDLVDDEKKLEAATPGCWLLLPYVLVFVPALLLVWGERFLHNPETHTLPGPLAWLPKVWPLRFMFMTAFSVTLLVLLVLQTWQGFGLDRAVKAVATEKFKDQLAVPDASSSMKIETQLRAGQEVAKYAVQGTTWLSLAMLAHAVAVLGILGRLWLANRGNQAPPRFALRY